MVSSAVPTYALPLLAAQKVGSVPQADCLNITACAKVLVGTPDRYKEYESRLDSLDSRMQQVSYANGVLYGSHGTAVDVGTSSSDVAQQSGVAWYEVRPTTAASTGNLTASVVHTGRLATARNNVTMPALAARSDGSAVMAMTLVGTDHYPSAAYVDLSASGATGPLRVLAEGAGPEDGFTGYRIYQYRATVGRLRSHRHRPRHRRRVGGQRVDRADLHVGAVHRGPVRAVRRHPDRARELVDADQPGAVT